MASLCSCYLLREEDTPLIPIHFTGVAIIHLKMISGFVLLEERDGIFKEEIILGAGSINHLPPGFEEGTGNKACLLKKSLYGLKQSPRQWYKRFDVYMTSNGFSRSNYDSCVYFKEFAPGMYIYLLLYVNDMLIAYKRNSEIEYTKGLLQKEFDMKELSPARKILGMDIVRDRGSRTLKVSQSGYVQKILNNYKVDNSRSVFVPLGAHFKGTADVGLVYGRNQGKHVDVDCFIDADYAKDPDKGRSITEYVFMVHGCVLKGLLIELGVNLRSVVVNCDNQSEIHLSRNAMFHERMKHINVRYHFIREIVESKEIEVAKIGTKNNAADVFTKVVPGSKFKLQLVLDIFRDLAFRDRASVCCRYRTTSGNRAAVIVVLKFEGWFGGSSKENGSGSNRFLGVAGFSIGEDEVHVNKVT
ncbi:retrovirus-related pol polyprotein from transposon TNT 1-94 [Tanacetum coccineum]